MCRCLRWIARAALAVAAMAVSMGAAPGEVTIVVSDPDGAAARVGAPVAVELDLAPAKTLDEAKRWVAISSGPVEVVEVGETAVKPARPVSVQRESPPVLDVPAAKSSRVLWFQMPPGSAGQRTFLLRACRQIPPSVMRGSLTAPGEGYHLIREEKSPVLMYRSTDVPAPPGVDAKYARAGYIHPLYGPDGEVLTDDFPKDHPHHRGVWWSWPVTRWKSEVRDIWAVVGVRSRPQRGSGGNGPVFGELRAVNLWKWGDRDPIVRETVAIRAFRRAGPGRFIDVELQLTALEDGVAIGGRPKGGYGGFAFRAAPTKEQKIVRHVDPPEAKPRRSWLDYSGLFPGDKQVVGVTILEHPSNPRYPSELQAYANINCVMPAFPGDREVPIPKGQTLTLKHRLWIHPGRADEKTLADVWSAYANPPKVTFAEAKE